MTSSQVGRPLDRVEGPDKVTGKARYAAEFPVPRLVHAVVVTSTVPAGTLAAIDAAQARRMPGVLRILTPDDAPKLSLDQAPKPPAGRVLGLLQDAQVHYNGQPIALVVAETEEQARAAATTLRPRYAPAEAHVDFAAAKPSAYKPEKANQLPTEASWGGDVDAAFAAAHARVDATYVTPVEHHNPIEPHATIARWDGDRLTVYDATQYVMGVRRVLAAYFALPPEKVHVMSPLVGGGFGCKGSAWSHVVLAAMAAKQLGRPVRIVLDRPQMFRFVGHRPRTEQHVRVAADADGRLVALDHASLSHTSTLEDWVEPAAAPARTLYAVANGRSTHRLVKLNLPTPTFMRAPGEASGSFALESALDELAVALALDPLQLRLRNYADADPAEGKPFSSKHLRECYTRGAERFGWSRRNATPGSLRDGRWTLGVGMASASYPANRSKASARATLHADGHAEIAIASHDLGTGTYTILTQIAADALALEPAQVQCRLGDTDDPEAPVAGGSQSAASAGPAVQAACEALKAQLAGIAVADEKSPLYRRRADELVADAGGLRATSAHETYAALLARHGGSSTAQASAEPGDAKKNHALHSFGAVFAEVAIDPELGILRVRRLHGTYDVGRVLNAKTARSQIEGGLVWGAGMALFERTELDLPTGRFVNANLADYHVPVNADIGELSVEFIDAPDTVFSPQGARGIGEIGITGAAAAIANAVYNALGKRLRELPLTPERLMA